MAESFEGLLKKGWHMEELKSLTSQIREHVSLLRLKRRWLMDLPLSMGEQKRIEEILPPNDKILPESFLREDDVSYSDVRTCIEMAFGVHNIRKEPHPFNEDVKIPNSRDVLQEVFLLLDALTNKGLCSLVKILTGGVTKFEKTNWSMKRMIKELLPEVVANKNDISKTKLKQLFRLLQDPSSYRGNQITAPMAYNAAVVKVLDGLGDFPSRALIAMHRKLNGVRGYIPSFRPPKNGEERDNLISRVKKKCMKMLSDTSEPSERLAGALGVAALTSKLMMNHPAMREFRRFSPEIKALQNDIVKAIHLLNEAKKVSLIELRKVQILLDPDRELSARSLRMAVRNLLTEYLYECGDMDTVPDFLIETLDIINRRSQLPSRKKGSYSEVHSSPRKLMEVMMEKEVECVLTISAQAKEVVSNLLPQHEFDEEFARAYTEDYDIDETLCVFDDDDEHFRFHSDNDSSAQEESVGETNPDEVNSPIGRLNTTNSGSHKTEAYFHSPFCDELNVLEAQKQYLSSESKIASSNLAKQSASYQSHSPARNSCYNDLKIEEKEIFSDLPQEGQEILTQRSSPVNEYLEVQEACDVTSVIAYRFVGLVLDKLAKFEGLELYQGDRLYLHNHASIRDDSEDNGDCCIAHRVFSGLLRSDVMCTSCGFTSTTYDPCVDISLDLEPNHVNSTKSASTKSSHSINNNLDTTNPSQNPSVSTLVGCLDRFTRPERLGSDQKFFCQQCQVRQESLKQMSIRKLPLVSCFHIKRFEHSPIRKMSRKIDRYLQFPLSLDMAPYLSSSILRRRYGNRLFPYDEQDGPSELSSQFELFAVITHSGKLDAGHYVTYLRLGDEWYKCDDAWITRVNDDVVRSAQGYMMFYVQKMLYYRASESTS